MSTRSVVAFKTPDGRFIGRYCHFDGYPSGVGKTLFDAYRAHFGRDLAKLRKFLIDDHPAGWSSLTGADFSKRPGYTDPVKRINRRANTPERAQCYCHGDRHEGRSDWTPDMLERTPVPFVYLFDPVRATLEIREAEYEPFNRYETRAVLWLDGPEPDWQSLDNGDLRYPIETLADLESIAPEGAADGFVG